MKKSNYLILGISTLASLFLLYLWFYLGFNKIDNPLDLVIGIIWWVVIVGLFVLINRWEAKRERRVRTVYLAPGALYNSETGVKELDAPSPLAAMEELLGALEYGFDVQDAPEREDFDYRYVVETDTFKASDSDDGDSESDPTWEGKVTKIDRVNGNTETAFSSKQELAELLA